ncbi:MAG TPA: ATP phosphoribosyltransferase [Campylobacterales bacterium]|nr:ATP phosphoribosyltransferase [Campylobacterales bacterium]
MLTIALPKGRIADQTLEVFERAYGEKIEFDDRKLILETENFKFLLVKNQDVVEYVLHQAADIGIAGLDILEERDLDLVKLLDLGFGKCKICVGMKNEDTLDNNAPEITIATKLVNITKKHFAKKAMAVKVIKLNGSIELAPIVGLSDAIVDIVETGTTMKQNGLKVVEDIMESSAHLIANKNSYISKKEEILNLYKIINDNIKELN